MFACGRVKPGAGFVKNQQARPAHQRPANQYPLPFALGKHTPGSRRQWCAFDLPENFLRPVFIRARKFPPEINHRKLAGRDGFQRRFVARHHLTNGGTDQSDLLAQFAPVRTAIRFAQYRDFTRSRCEISRQRAQQGGFTGSVGAQENPMLPASHLPGYAVQNGGAPALHAQVTNFKNGGSSGIHWSFSISVQSGRRSSSASAIFRMASFPPIFIACFSQCRATSSCCSWQA